MAPSRNSLPLRVAIYARVSTVGHGQDIGLQLDELRALAVQRGWTLVAEFTDDGVSGAKQSRPGLDKMMAAAQAGEFEHLLVWKLDRLGRSLQHLLQLLDDLTAHGVGFTSARDPGLSTSTSTGRLLLQLLGSFAEYERAIIQERVQAGVARAKAKGIHCGRPRREIDLRVVQALMGEGRSVRETATIIGVPRSTLQRRLRELGKGGPKVTAHSVVENAGLNCQQPLPENPA